MTATIRSVTDLNELPVGSMLRLANGTNALKTSDGQWYVAGFYQPVRFTSDDLVLPVTLVGGRETPGAHPAPGERREHA